MWDCCETLHLTAVNCLENVTLGHHFVHFISFLVQDFLPHTLIVKSVVHVRIKLAYMLLKDFKFVDAYTVTPQYNLPRYNADRL